MKVFGHDDVSDDEEAIFFPHIFKYFKECTSRAGSSEEAKPSITTTGNEMKIALTVMADEPCCQSNIRPFRRKNVVNLASCKVF